MKVPAFEMPLEEIRASLDKLRRPLSIAVLRARNPFNVGAIIRVAHSFLVREIILVGSERYYERGAMGMDRYENIVCVADEAALIARVRAGGGKLVVFEKDAARVDLWQADLPAECTMVFGSEATGVPDEIVRAADMVVGIPMYGINHSFPVTVAAGIAMAEWTRRHYVYESDPPPLPIPSPRASGERVRERVALQDRQRLHVRRVRQHVERRDAARPVAARREPGEVAGEGVADRTTGRRSRAAPGARPRPGPPARSLFGAGSAPPRRRGRRRPARARRHRRRSARCRCRSAPPRPRRRRRRPRAPRCRAPPWRRRPRARGRCRRCRSRRRRRVRPGGPPARPRSRRRPARRRRGWPGRRRRPRAAAGRRGRRRRRDPRWSPGRPACGRRSVVGREDRVAAAAVDVLDDADHLRARGPERARQRRAVGSGRVVTQVASTRPSWLARSTTWRRSPVSVRSS